MSSSSSSSSDDDSRSVDKIVAGVPKDAVHTNPRLPAGCRLILLGDPLALVGQGSFDAVLWDSRACVPSLRPVIHEILDAQKGDESLMPTVQYLVRGPDGVDELGKVDARVRRYTRRALGIYEADSKDIVFACETPDLDLGV